MTTNKSIKICGLQFEPFKPWNERGSVPKSPGIYVITKGNCAKPIYIGLTVQAKGLAGRLRQFDRSASSGRPSHAGGMTYHRKFGQDLDDLQVAVHHPKLQHASGLAIKTYIQYIERKLIWDHFQLYGELPVCNSI